MGYDMETEAGVIIDGSTKYDPGYYQGERIYKVGDDILKVYGSKYTTCEYTKPHYSFRAKKMKVYVGDKIVSGPIVAYIGEVPVFYLPYMVNSLRRDRHSGILRPNFDIGFGSREGRFIRGLGYYWATNDYTDFIFTFDFNENKNVRMHVDNRYKLRYVLDGDVNFNIYRDLNTGRREWTLDSRHTQTLSKTSSFAANLRFVSGDNAQVAIDRSEDTRRIVDRKIYSTASYRKKWGGTSLSLSARRDQVLNVASATQDRISMTLPSLSLNLPRTSFWFGEKHAAGERGFWERVLGGVMFTPNLSANHQRQESDARTVSTRTARSSASFSKQLKFTIIDLSPALSLNWNYRKVSYGDVDTAYTDVYRPDGSRDYTNEISMGLSSGLGTKLYGTFYPGIGALQGIRHTFNPSVSVRYTPPPFAIGWEPEGATKREASTTFSYSVRNVLDLKMLSDTTTTKKNNAFTWNLSGSFNPKLDANKQFSTISSSMRTGFGNVLTLNLDHSWDPNIKRILSTSFGAGLNLSGGFSYPGRWTHRARETIAPAGDSPEPEIEQSPLGMAAAGRQGWVLNLTYKYTSRLERGIDYLTGAIDESNRVDSSVDISGNIQVTKNWRLTYRTHYNIQLQEIVEQSYSLARDLHCWQASFVYRTYGNDWTYYFQIAIKAHSEIMYERGPRGIQSPYGGFY
jgi:lipopolysaccharide assembly outer membrane protein LptD (OstA)